MQNRRLQQDIDDLKQRLALMRMTAPPDDDEKQEIIEWLTNQIQLPQYIETFVSTGYDTWDEIKKLTTIKKLAEIGITKLGHQLQIKEHIDKL